MAKGEGKVVAQNKKASHDYTIVETIEAGMVLTGTEIKSVRAARINLQGWNLPKSKMGKSGSAMFILLPMRKAISGTKTQSAVANSCCIRSKIQKLEQETKGTGMTLVPLKVYLKDG